MTELNDKSTQQRLVETFQVPAHWLAEAEVSCGQIMSQSSRVADVWKINHHAQADHYRNLCDPYAEMLACKRAYLFERAHTVAIQQLVPEAILQEDTELVTDLLEGLQYEAIEGWSKGGQVSARLLYFVDSAVL